MCITSHCFTHKSTQLPVFWNTTILVVCDPSAQVWLQAPKFWNLSELDEETVPISLRKTIHTPAWKDGPWETGSDPETLSSSFHPRHL